MDLNSNLISIFWNSHNQPQGNTNKATIGTTLSILTNANEFNNNVPITPVPNNQMNQEWGIIKNAPEPVQGIIQETLVLPPLQNCQHELDNHPIDKNNSNMASHNQTPKTGK